MKLTIRYGADEVTKNFDSPQTVGDIKDDDNIRAALGFGDNVNALVGGVAQNDATTLPEGAVVTIETAANTKA